MNRLTLSLLLALLPGVVQGDEDAGDLRLYGEYAFLFHNTEYDAPSAPRSDQRTYLVQTLELGARWELSPEVVLRAGLELEHNIGDTLDGFTDTLDSFLLHPRLRLGIDLGWGSLELGHLEPTPRPLTFHFAHHDQPPAGLGFSGDLGWLDWELVALRTSRVGAETKEVFLAAGTIQTRPFDGLRLPLFFAYSHAGGYDTLDYQEYEPPDGVRKAELWNLGAALGASLPLGALELHGELGGLLSLDDHSRGEAAYLSLGVEGSWWRLGLEQHLSEDTFRSVRPRGDLVRSPRQTRELDGRPADPDARTIIEGALFGFLGPVEVLGLVRVGLYGVWGEEGYVVQDNYNVLILRAAVSF